MESTPYLDQKQSQLRVEKVSDDTPPSKKFEEYMEEEEFEEEEPLLDGPVAPTLSSIFFHEANKPKPLPHSLSEIIPEILEPIKEASLNGITRTDIYIQSKTLSEIKVTIDHYDTAPHSFNIYLSGNEKACNLFIQYQNELAQNLQKALPSFCCNFFTPTFREKKPLVKTKRFSYCAEKVKKYD